jgi:hypothetical protein
MDEYCETSQNYSNSSTSLNTEKPNANDDNILNNLSTVKIRGYSMISILIDGKERICLSQISNTLLKKFSYNEIHNRRVALGINCHQCKNKHRYVYMNSYFI